MSWLSSLLQHNKAWILPVATSAALAAGQSLTQGKINWTLVGGAALTAAAAAAKSPVTPSPQTAAQDAVSAVVQQVAANVQAGAPLGTQAVVRAAEQVAQSAVAGAVEQAIPLPGNTTAPGNAGDSPG
jgi:hypothetical protein